MKNEKRREIEYVALFSFFYFVLSRNLFNNKRIKSIFSSLNFLKKKKKSTRQKRQFAVSNVA